MDKELGTDNLEYMQGWFQHLVVLDTGEGMSPKIYYKCSIDMGTSLKRVHDKIEYCKLMEPGKALGRCVR